MVNKCCLKYCKSGASGFVFPRQEKFPDLSKKIWIEFVNDPDFKPSVHSWICIEHFDGKYVKNGKRNHLIWDTLPIPTIHTNVETKTAKQDFSLTVPKAPRKPPRKIIFQEDELSRFLEEDSIENFAALTEKDCLPGFTFVQKENSVNMFRLEIEPKSNIPVVKESISIDKDLHVSLSYCCFHVPLPDWFRAVHNCKLLKKSALENFPPYNRSRGEQMNPVLKEINEMQLYKAKGRPQFSSQMIRYAFLTTQ